MNRISALRPLTALAASTVLLGTVALAASAHQDRQQTVAGAVSTAHCVSWLPDNPTTSINLGPLYQHAQ